MTLLKKSRMLDNLKQNPQLKNLEPETDMITKLKGRCYYSGIIWETGIIRLSNQIISVYY